MREASCHVDRAYLVYREGFIAMEITIKWQDESVPLPFYRKIAGTKKLQKVDHRHKDLCRHVLNSSVEFGKMRVAFAANRLEVVLPW